MSVIGPLLEQELPQLRRYAQRLTRDKSQAEDLVQNCVVRALVKEHLWQPGTDLRAWLFTLLHNEHVNNVRRSIREGLSVAIETLGPVLSIGPTAESALA